MRIIFRMGDLSVISSANTAMAPSNDRVYPIAIGDVHARLPCASTISQRRKRSPG